MFRSITILLFLSSLLIAQINYDSGVVKGRITFYSQSPAVACDIPESEWPQYTTALNEKAFQGGLACGATVRLMNNGKEIHAMVVDLCPVVGNEEWCSGDMTHFDLGGQTAFAQLEPAVTGVKVVDFEWVPTPVGNTPVKLRLKDGINAWWVAIEVINHRYPIAKLEIKNPSSGAWITGDRTKPGMYNYWQFSFTGNGLSAPFQIRITDQYGQVIEETGTVIQEKYMWAGKNQFPLLAKHGGSAAKRPSFQKTSRRTAVSLAGNRLYFSKDAAGPVRIYDPAGRMVAATALPTGGGSVLLPELPRGVYIIKTGAASTAYWIKTEL